MPQVHRSVEGVYHNTMKKILLSLVIIVAGAGCASSARPSMPALPVVNIESPANGTITASSSVQVVGQSNVPTIFVDGRVVDVPAGQFVVPVHLVEGTNPIEILAGNGYTSTSLILNVTRKPQSSPVE
jgi:hypothetical protein